MSQSRRLSATRSFLALGLAVGLVALLSSGDPAAAQDDKPSITIQQCTRTFDGGGDGVSWGQATNWNPDTLPGSTPDEVICIGGSFAVTHSFPSFETILSREHTSTQPFTISGGGVTITGNSSISAAGLIQSGGSISGTGTLEIAGPFTWSGGTQGGAGITNANGDITLSGNGSKTLSGRTINSSGTATVTGTGSLQLRDGAVFNNNGGFDLQTAAGITPDFFGGPPHTFNNNGIFVKSDESTSIIGVEFNNAGQVEVGGGELKFDAGGSCGGVCNGVFSFVGAGGTLNFGGGTFDYGPFASMEGFNNTVEFSGATVNHAGLYSPGGTTTFSGGAANFTGTVQVGGPISLSAGVANFSSGDAITPLLVTHTGGTLTGSDTLTVSSGPYDWSGGIQSGTGVTTAAAGLTLSGAGLKTLSGRTLNNSGTASVTGTGSLQLGDGAVFNNTGAFDLQTSAGIAAAGALPRTFNNAGTFTKSAGADSFVNVPFNNSGTVNASSAVLLFNGGGNCGGVCNGSFNSSATLRFSGGTFDLGEMAILAGSGGVEFSSGTVNLAGTYNVTGPTIFSGGTLNYSGAGTALMGVVTQTAGTLTGSGTVSAVGMYTWSGGTQSGSGVTSADGGLTLSGAFNNKVLSGRTLNNPGSATNVGTGSLLIGSGAVINNRGTFELQSDGGVLVSGGLATFNNTGSFTKSGGAGLSNINVQFNNPGTVNAFSGELQLAGGGNCGSVCNGAFNVASTLSFGGGTFELGGAMLSGAGTMKVSGGVVNHLAGTVLNVGMLTLSGGTANFSTGGPITLSTVIQNGGTLTGADTVTVTGLYDWSGGTQSGSGKTNANGGLTLGGSNSKSLLGRTLNSPATSAVTGSGSLFLSNGGVFENEGAFDLQSNASVTAGTPPHTFSNAGTFVKSGGGGLSAVNVEFNNSGTVNASSGELQLAGGGSCGGACDGSYNVSSKLSFAGGTFGLGPSASVTGAGAVEFGGTATVNLPGTYNVTGATLITGSGTVNFTGTAMLAAVTQTGGTLAATGPVSMSGTYDWSGGRHSGSGTTTALGGILFGGSSAKTLAGRVLTNPASATFSGTGSLVVETGGVLANNGTFDLQTGAGILASGNPPWSTSNTGTFIKSGGAQSTVGVDFSNSGTLDIAASSINFSAGFGQTSGSTRLCAASALFFNFTGGVFRAIPPGPCAVSGNLNNTSGTVFAGDGSGLPTIVNVSGNYTQGVGASFSVPLGGTSPGGALNSHGQMNITGSAALSGALSASLVGGFTPAAGNTFTVMTYGSRLGAFSSSSLPNISPLSWHISQGSTSVMLSAVAAGSPLINSGGSVNSASFAPGAGVAPGSIAAVFGSNLASSMATAGALPLPTTLGGATMLFNNNQAVPKFFATDSQINIQIPWELQGAMSANLTDTVNGVTGPNEPVSLAMFAPGVFAVNQAGTGQGAILIATTTTFAAPTGSIPGAQSRAAVRGVDFLEIYCTGLGPVSNQPATGNAAGASPLSATTANASVTIGGVPATVLFSGLAPGFVGLYVVTLPVPAGAPTGNAVNVVLTIGGVQSNTVTIAVE